MSENETFYELRKHRRFLQDLCAKHAESLLHFVIPSNDPFALPGSCWLHAEEKEADAARPRAPTVRTLRHLTSSATCIESLLKCPKKFRCGDEAVSPYIDWAGQLPRPPTFETMAATFAQNALLRPIERWNSDGSAPVYARCRALPLVLRHHPAPDDPAARATVKRLIGELLSQIDLEGGTSLRIALGETDFSDRANWYQPNAFHTYWTLETLRLLAKRWGPLFQTVSTDFRWSRIEAFILVWAENQLYNQISLHVSESSQLDPHQLVWALAICAKFGKHREGSKAVIRRELCDKALECIFSQQRRDGFWDNYAPLFHYRTSGNAYCYAFETLSALLERRTV